MKNNLSTKLMLLGIAFIAFFSYAQYYMNGADSVISNIIIIIGVFFPIVGLILCIAGFFVKDK